MALTAAEHEVTGWAEAVEAYFERGWTDGLPVVPATAEAVQSFLDAAGRKPGDVVLREATRRRSITAEKVAINAVMAGCRADYMPVLLAALEAMADPAVTLHGAVTVYAAEAPHNVLSHYGESAEAVIVAIADTMASLGSFSPGESFVVLAPEHVQILARDGWTKPRIREGLYARARRTRADLKRGG